MASNIAQALFATLIIFSIALAEPQDDGQHAEAPVESEEEKSMFTVVDIAIFLTVVVGIYYYYFRDSDADKIPEYEIKPMVVRQASSNSQSDKGYLSKMRNSKRRLVVFYGSQTGTAEEFAGRLAKEGAKYGLKGLVADPEEEDMNTLNEITEVEKDLGPCIAVFMLATYGEGDPTDNCMEFNEILRNSGFNVEGLQYAVFGLGNKTYEHFNAMAKFTDAKLEEMGGVRIHALGLGDDDANLEDDFITWKEAFWKSVCTKLNIEASNEEYSTRQYELKTLKEGDYKEEKVYTGEVARLRSLKNQRPPFDVKNPFLAPIKVNRNLHKESSDRHCMHIEFDISNSRIRYEAGDHVGVYPTNNEEIVNKLGAMLDVELDDVFTMNTLDEDSTKKHPFPCPTTYRVALKHYVDIVALPRTHVLIELARYTEDPAEKAKLELMGSTTPEGKALYQKWIIDDVRHLLHILEDMPSCRPPIDHLLELLPRLQPRFYSIASSNKVHPNSIHVCGVVIEYKTPTGRVNKGVCTTWLREKIPQEDNYPRVPIFVRRSTFRLPNRPNHPIIMIGPGTGLAPFIGFMQDRVWQAGEKDAPVNKLFFGCRKKAEDYIYQDLLEEWESKKQLQLHVAFSRDQAEKRYVTHMLREEGQEVWNILNNAGYIYVCGDAKMMAKDVRNALLDICKEHGGKTDEDAESFLKKLESEKRYCADVWS